jgi:hypothetical protein
VKDNESRRSQAWSHREMVNNFIEVEPDLVEEGWPTQY